MVYESDGTIDPYRIRLTHWDGKYAGDFDVRRGMLVLFSRGSIKEVPLLKLIEQIRRRHGEGNGE